MKVRDDFSWGLAVLGWILLSLAACYAVLCGFVAVVGPGGAPPLFRGLFSVFCIASFVYFGFMVKQTNWEDLCPWDFQQRRTSKSSPPSQSLSSFLAFQGNVPNPALSPPSFPSASRSLPSVTIDQPAVGFRQWRLDGVLRLHPIAHDLEPWTAITRAKCGVGSHHQAPNQECACGLYAYFTPPSASWPVSGAVTGAVLGSGRILRHPTEGFRAETMRVLALAHPPLMEIALEVCPKLPSIWLGSSRPSAAPEGAPAIRSADGNYYQFGHVWQTEDRTLELPTGTHYFQIKLKCKACGCGSAREFSTLMHTADLKQLEDLAASLGVPVIPVEKIAGYAAEFGVLPAEVKALAA